MNDSELDELLRGAREHLELPSSFQHQVWQKIDAGTKRKMPQWAWASAILEWLARPVPAAAAWSLALMGGLLMGVLKPQPAPPGAHAEAYAQMINPLAKMHTP
jgi:hypothetical protein